MKIQSILDEIEILVKLGQQEDAMRILKIFQRNTLFDYKKWYEERYPERGLELALYSFNIEKFNNENSKRNL